MWLAAERLALLQARYWWPFAFSPSTPCRRATPALPVLQDPHLLAPQPVSFARKPARTEEDVVRRRELARVADELRSVLALRGAAGKGNPAAAAKAAAGKPLTGGGGRLSALAAKPPAGSSGGSGEAS